MKKILSMLLALMLLISVGTVMAFAATDFTLTVTADKAEAAPGDEVTFTFTLAGSGKYDCISFKVEADSGLEYVGSETGSGFGSAEGSATVSFDNKNGFYMFSGIGSDIAAGKLFTAKYKVSSSAAAGAVLNVKVSTDKTGTSAYSYKDKFILSYNNTDKTCTVTNGSVKVKSTSVVVPGDVDGNGKVNAKDLTALKKYLADDYDSIDEYNAAYGTNLVAANIDIDGNGKINAKDLTALKALLAE